MPEDKHKVLIIKLGYSETLVPEFRRTASLGDVLRTTAVLHLYKNDHVTWLTDEAAIPLLRGNPYIHRILPFDLLSVLQLQSERFDKVINLEKVPGVCALVDRVRAWSHYGFRFDSETGVPQAYERSYEALAIATREDFKKLNDRPWLEVLFEMLGAEWNGEHYILGYRPSSETVHDVGFNHNVGTLMPVKAWPMENWKVLEERLKGKASVSWQQHLDDLEGYMEWIQSCRLLVTNDSLGIFVGLALGKKVLALFGPTSPKEHSPHPLLRCIQSPADLPCMPCCQDVCAHNDPCMKYILPETVEQAALEWLSE